MATRSNVMRNPSSALTKKRAIGVSVGRDTRGRTRSVSPSALMDVCMALASNLEFALVVLAMSAQTALLSVIAMVIVDVKGLTSWMLALNVIITLWVQNVLRYRINHDFK